jgi:hypothetical protein
VAHAVEVTRVEQVDAGGQSGVDRGDALGAVGRPVHAGHTHAAEPDLGYRGAVGAQTSCFHARSIRQ